MLLQRVDRAWTRSGCLVFSRYLMGTGIKKALDLRERAIDAISKANLIRRSLNKLGENNTPRVLQGMDAISNEICAVMDVCELVRNCHMDDVYIDEAERTFQELHVYISELNTDKGLHLLLTKIVDNQIIFKSLSEEDKIIVVDLKREFEAAGVHIEEQTKREKSLELQRLTQEVENSYTRNAYNHFDTFRLGPIEDKDLFSSVQSFAAQFVSQPQTLPASTVLCNADNRLISNLLVSLDDEKLRKILWESSLMVPSGNVGALGSLIKTRQSLARALSHPSYAHKVLSNRMVKSPNQVWALLEKISQEINPSLLDQMKLLQGSSDVKIQPWNLPYLMNNYKYEMQQQGGARSLTAIAPFLSLSACVNSLKFVTHELFGIHVRERPLKQEELWGWSLAQERTVSGMMRLDLYDSSEEFLGTVYLDLFKRNKKINQPAHLTLRCGCIKYEGTDFTQEVKTSRQTPIVALLLNVAPSGSADPSLSLGELEALYHEWGHALHSVLSRTTSQHLSGTRGGVDFVEVPSHLFEYFCRSPAVVEQWARHRDTGAHMPRDLLVEAFKLKNVFDSIETQSQLLLSAADQIVFGPDLGDLSELSDEDCYWQAMGKVTQWQRRWTNIPIVLNKDGLELAAFNALVHPHFITYGGEYYCYLFAKQKAKEIWERHFSGETPLSRQGGIVLRHSMLALGSAREPTRILEDLLC